LACVGLDPLKEKMPECFAGRASTAKAFEDWMVDIAKAVGPYVSMLKPQSAHWEAVPGGLDALGRAIERIHDFYPDLPIFSDCKRGDIARTQGQYRVAQFDILGMDGMNFSPYMGIDCMSALVDKTNPVHGIVGLCYTSNPKARQVQDALMQDGKMLWEQFAEWILEWSEELGIGENAGLVMAAAYEWPTKGSGDVYSEHLLRCRRLVGDKLWFLIPGIGTQKGCVKETVQAAYAGPGSMVISSSSEVIFASKGDDYKEAAAAQAKALRDDINQYRIR
jgi:orotidine-5'-phosphate decarboxylase